MNRTTRTPLLTALTLALAVGTTTSAWAQSESRDHARPSQRDKNADRKENTSARTEEAMPAGVDFRSCHKLRGHDIVNESGESVGDVADLVLDRGSGRVDYVVVRTGSVMDLGGKSVAVPYGALRWNPGKDQFVLTSTRDQLKQYPEFNAARWSEMMESRKGAGDESKQARDQRDKNADQRGKFPVKDDRGSGWMLPDSPRTSNLYSGRYDTSKKMHIEGEVTSVDRVRTGTADEEVIVTVATSDGSTKRVSVGPSWFVAGGAAAPMRGDKISADTYAITGTPDLYTAGRVRIGDRDVNLRENNGNPAWDVVATDAGGRSYGSHYWHYVLASNVRGMKVECRGTECGKVNDVIVDRNSGEVAMLSIDPNQNFLGIADTKRLVPWTVASVALAGTVRIDATKEMILASPETPGDLSTLNMSDRTKMVFDAYQVPVPDFTVRKHVAAIPPRTLGDTSDAWGASGPIAASVDRNSSKTLVGTIAGISEVKFDKDVTPAKALKVRTTSGDEETVLLGPAWYLNTQIPEYKSGDAVTVSVCKARVNGTVYWITTSVECDGKRVALWENDRPVWDDR